jgi:hypothetical protein
MTEQSKGFAKKDTFRAFPKPKFSPVPRIEHVMVTGEVEYRSGGLTASLVKASPQGIDPDPDPGRSRHQDRRYLDRTGHHPARGLHRMGRAEAGHCQVRRTRLYNRCREMVTQIGGFQQPALLQADGRREDDFDGAALIRRSIWLAFAETLPLLSRKH